MIGSKLFLKASSHPISLSCMYALRTRTRTRKHRPYIPVNVSMFVTSLRTHYCCLIHISVICFQPRTMLNPALKTTRMLKSSYSVLVITLLQLITVVHSGIWQQNELPVQRIDGIEGRTENILKPNICTACLQQ